MISKIKIKYGQIEIECEASEEFLKKDLFDLLKTMSDLPQALEKIQESESVNKGVNSAHKLANSTNSSQLSVNTIAQKMGVKKGPELTLAACVKMHTEGKESFSQKEILSEMRNAKSFFKSSHGSNLGNSLKTLAKNGKLNHLKGDNYSLSDSSQTEFKQLLHY